jgi:hypothetical protein
VALVKCGSASPDFGGVEPVDAGRPAMCATGAKSTVARRKVVITILSGDRCTGRPPAAETD